MKLKNLPTDAFVEILLRLPPSSLWRFRLVSRHWRTVIDERTPRSRPKALAFCVNGKSAYAYVIDDLADGRCRAREVWRHRFKAMVGTCNGLLCLCSVSSGDIVVVNPVTGETLDVPRCPAEYRNWKAFSFGFHLPTGLYKIVYLPLTYGFIDEVQVLTLGDASWRRVAVAGGSSCRLAAGVVSVDGATFWVTEGADRVASFDLGDERVRTVPMPVEVGHGFSCHLTEVNGRLGVAVISTERPMTTTPAKIEVWVLGEGIIRDRRTKWSRRYSVQVQGVERLLARPHFAYGDHVLTTDTRKRTHTHMQGELTKMFGHNVGRPLVSGEVRSVWIREPGTAVSGIIENSNLRGIFAYDETTEPLSCYRAW
ncbi:hypothetical protein PR202_gb02795 [Eleusine coracana subsp. coracana]|uniref:F-box domain-containing protein n=1 Tax=Eleusine coracana subsp. coracana TaxID=191504 RepID=A0AAV5E000_ELECO|nr:hypothetical protein QOZ80_8BG0664550 [Eleusine coracana subsp. coracana]GJN15851.1 hypothetical protein PR202_gb02795 [Eleusine coracana subsp. coracana]